MSGVSVHTLAMLATIETMGFGSRIDAAQFWADASPSFLFYAVQGWADL